MHKPFTNWVDGMKLSKDHFIDLENSLYEKVLDSNSVWVNDHNYGLIYHPAKNIAALEYSIDIDRNDLVRLKVNEINALTAGGHRIYISKSKMLSVDEKLFDFEKPIQSTVVSDKLYYTILTVNSFERQSYGMPDASEIPPRYPFTHPKYDVVILSEDEFMSQPSGVYQMPISRFRFTGAGLKVDHSYIPPCTRMSSHPDLMDVFHQLLQFLSQAERDTCEIIMRIYSRNQTTPLAQSVLYLMEDILRYVSGSISYFRNMGADSPPLYSISYIMDFARVVNNSIDCKGGSGKELMLNYFRNWIMELKQGEFEFIVDNTLKLNYDHKDINNALDVIGVFSTTISKVLKELSTLDYIGEQNKRGPVIDSKASSSPTYNQPPPRAAEPAPRAEPVTEPKAKKSNNRFVFE